MVRTAIGSRPFYSAENAQAYYIYMCYIYYVLRLSHTRVCYSRMGYNIYKVAKAPRVLHFSAFQ